MELWVRLFPRSDKMEQMLLQTFEDGSGNTFIKPSTGITCGERFAFLVFIVAGKMAVAAVLLCAGTGLVLRASSNFDLVLNAVA